MSIRPSGRAVKLSMKGLLVLLLAGCQFDGRQMVAAMSDAMRQDDDLNETISESSADEGATGVESAADEVAVDDANPEMTSDQGEGLASDDSNLEQAQPSGLGRDQSKGSPRPPWNSPYEVYGDRYIVKETSRRYREVGIASWYGKKFQGRKTSNGEIFDMNAISAAHKTLPIPTMVRVTNLDNGQKIDVRINDRGPFHDDRILDLSYAAAKALGFSDQGTAPVVVEALDALNYPGEAATPKKAPNIDLQAGAFQAKSSADKLKRDIETTFMLQRLNAKVRVLESELEAEVKLHKVWIGPILSTNREAMISTILSQMGLAKPVKVVAN